MLSGALERLVKVYREASTTISGLRPWTQVWPRGLNDSYMVSDSCIVLWKKLSHRPTVQYTEVQQMTTAQSHLGLV
jgi:hypothetical protein